MTANASVRVRRSSVAVAALVALASSTPAIAQTQLYLLTSEYDVVVTNPVPNPECQPWDYGCENRQVPGSVTQLDVERRQIVATTPISHALGAVIGPRPTPDGRFLLWSGSSVAALARYQVSLFDIARRQQARPLAASVSSVPLTVHPSAMRAFLQLSSGGPVTVAEPDHTHTLLPPPCAAPRFESQSGDGSRLSYYCDVPRSVIVADSGDGRLLATVPLGASSFTVGATSHVLDATGRNLYVVDWDNAFEGDLESVWYRRFDVATGALLSERRGSTNAIFTWTLNETTGHLYAGTWAGILVIDANSLVEIGWLGGPHWGVVPKIALDPEQPHAYIAWPATLDTPNARVSLVHTWTLATLGSIDIPVGGEVAGLVLGPRPPRVSELTILVEDRLATLSWATDTSRSLATAQVVEVGFTPQETALRLGVAAGATSLTVPGVPPGRYYVRIRAVNGTGIGAPSNEVLVDVP